MKILFLSLGLLCGLNNNANMETNKIYNTYNDVNLNYSIILKTNNVNDNNVNDGVDDEKDNGEFYKDILGKSYNNKKEKEIATATQLMLFCVGGIILVGSLIIFFTLYFGRKKKSD